MVELIADIEAGFQGCFFGFEESVFRSRDRPRFASIQNLHKIACHLFKGTVIREVVDEDVRSDVPAFTFVPSASPLDFPLFSVFLLQIDSADLRLDLMITSSLELG